MLMFPNSGLTNAQAARVRMTHVETPVKFQMMKFILPIVACSAGLAIVSSFVSLMLTAVVLAVGGVFTASVILMAQRVRKLLADDADRVTVVRSGLLRVIDVEQVAVGDVLVLDAGALVPVDGVQSTIAVKESRVFNAFGVQRGAVFAGMRVAQSGTLCVTATGSDRRLVTALTDGKPVTFQQIMFMLGAGVRQILLDARPVVRLLLDFACAAFAHTTSQQVDDQQHVGSRNTGRLRLAQVENVFRYNQGPVS